MQRSVLILILALVVVLLMTAIIFENPPITDDVASVERPRMPAESVQREVERHLTLARGYVQRGDMERAYNSLHRALMRDREEPRVLQLLGVVQVSRGEVERAEEAFRTLIRVDQDNSSAYSNLAVTLLLQQQYAAAREVATDGLAVTAEFEQGPLQLVLAAAAASQGQQAASRQALEQAQNHLGADLFRFTHASWASALRELPRYQELMAEAGVSAPSQEEQVLMPPAAK